MTWLDRMLLEVAPRWALRRLRARVAGAALTRHYEAAGVAPRTQGWRRPSSDANAVTAPALGLLRNTARDVVRNNPYAQAAVSTLVDHVVGWGILGAPKAGNVAAAKRWRAWAETTACDPEGRLDFAGIQKQVLRTVIESGEVLIRRRVRRPEDGLPIPLQLQVLEPDYLDSARDGITNAGGGRIIQGVEFNPIGQRIAYHLTREHPGSLLAPGAGQADRIPASEVLHVWHPGRPGQVRGVSWFAPVLLRLKDLDDYEDAALMKQKIAACLSVITTDVEGTGAPLGRGTDPDAMIDTLEPGLILNAPAGRSVAVVSPPDVSEHETFVSTTLRSIASALGLGYEDLTGDYAQMPFSAARMSRLRLGARVEDWRWNMLIPQLCDPVWEWAMQLAATVDPAIPGGSRIPVEWTAPAMPMVDPAQEGLAYMRNIRAGLMTLSEAIRERGYHPAALLREMAADNKLLDDLELRLDSDPRYLTQAGQFQSMLGGGAPEQPAEEPEAEEAQPAASTNGNGRK